jgi:bacteriocin biosynthesis cyclodehydratase domain-containing protein
LAATLPVAGVRVAATAAGSFGGQVAALLASGNCHVVAPDEVKACFASGVDAVVVAMWRACPSLCEQTDGQAFRYGVPWLPVVMEHPRLRIGPWVDPLLGPCYECYRQRKIQHDTHHAATSALEGAYERDPACGPGGYLPHHARVAAGIAGMTLRRGIAARRSRGLSPGPAGEVSVINVLTWQTATHRVIARHGCPRCGREDGPGNGLGAVLATTHAAAMGKTA